MHWVLQAVHHPSGVSVVPILLGAFLVGFAVQRVLAAAGNRWWPVPAEPSTAADEDPARSEGPRRRAGSAQASGRAGRRPD